MRFFVSAARMFLGLLKVMLNLPQTVGIAVHNVALTIAVIVMTSPLLAHAKIPDNFMKEILSADSTTGVVKGVLLVIAIGLILSLVYGFTQGDKSMMVISGVLAGFTLWLINDWDTFLGWLS